MELKKGMHTQNCHGNITEIFRLFYSTEYNGFKNKKGGNK